MYMFFKCCYHLLTIIRNVTEQGYGYAGIIGTPNQPESEVPIIATSAWSISTHGHNERVMRNMVRAGNYVMFLGSEGSFRPNQKPEPISPIRLENSAAAVLNFAYHTADELNQEGHDIEQSKRIVIGESRGGMTAMGIAALDNEFGQEVILADLTAPCLPRKMKLGDISRLINQISGEPKEIIRLGGSLALSRLIHYPSTIDPHPESLKHQIASGPALFSGDSGELARHIRKDLPMHITVFENDFASMPDDWSEIFKDHPDVRITPLSGSHLTLADPETLKYIIARNKATQRQLAIGGLLTRKTIFDAAHEIAPTQTPLYFSDNVA